MAAPRGGIYNRRATREEDESDNESVADEYETGRVYEVFEKYVKPMFSKDKKWFWWNVGFFSTAVLFTKTHCGYQMDWMLEFLTKESPLDKAMQQQVPGQGQPRM
eukprot:CAMPEP_0202698766 /NCGR_PEP_ID=MMETSP1385-20130828/12001_1 /ASSEMBLY_ACC=CAM_ASM_000861 /TAXON_ID=933848 /ORGANISM="Elphidium margaritaceum" /LENGTH=104 /DNA_ID=CAMNT_0049355539 /DNA_START=52 /DNA_END=366 /DNA_ORIENTATION=-